MLGRDYGSVRPRRQLPRGGRARKRPLRDTFELFVGADGCYTATASAESLGGPSLTAESGRAVRNLLYAFEGCFDIT